MFVQLQALLRRRTYATSARSPIASTCSCNITTWSRQ
jgi:hypothetical protein